MTKTDSPDRAALHIPWAVDDGGEALAQWIAQQLAEQGLRLVGPLNQIHLRPWSTVIRVPIAKGALVAKASAPALRHEAALTQWLAQRWPEDVVQVVAADSTRGWLLLQDGGVRLRESLKADDGLETWDPILSRYAEIQQKVADSSSQLLALRVPDRRPARLHNLLLELLQAAPGWGNEDEPPLSDDELAQLAQAADGVRERADEISAFAIRPTIEHGDLHDGNVFASNGDFRLFDWGDSAISHPFFSLRTTYVSAELRFGLPEGDLRLDRLQQQYLQAWQPLMPMSDLKRAFALVRSLWALPAAVRWFEALREADAAARAEYGYAIPSLMRELLDDLRLSRG